MTGELSGRAFQSRIWIYKSLQSIPDWNENVFDWKALRRELSSQRFRYRKCCRSARDWKAKVVDWKALGRGFQSRI